MWRFIDQAFEHLAGVNNIVHDGLYDLYIFEGTEHARLVRPEAWSRTVKPGDEVKMKLRNPTRISQHLRIRPATNTTSSPFTQLDPRNSVHSAESPALLQTPPGREPQSYPQRYERRHDDQFSTIAQVGLEPIGYRVARDARAAAGSSRQATRARESRSVRTREEQENHDRVEQLRRSLLEAQGITRYR